MGTCLAWRDEIWERWKNALEREQRWTVLHAVSGVAVELKRQLYARRLDSAMRAQEISLAQLEEVVAAAAAHQVHPTSVEKARAEIDTAKQRCRDAQGAAENRLVDRADAMLWKLKKGRIRMDDWTKREGPLWDMVNAIQEAEGAQDWQAMQAAIAGWREERPGSNHEAFEDPSSPTRLFRRAQERCGELRMKEFRQEVNDILNRCSACATREKFQYRGAAALILQDRAMDIMEPERELMLSPCPGALKRDTVAYSDVEVIEKEWPGTVAEFGSKSIGFWGGVMLLINNVAGPTVSLMPGNVR
eukprot:s257_g8.t1